MIPEDSELVSIHKIKEILNSGTNNCVCQIITKSKKGNGFFVNIRVKKRKFLITTNNIIDQAYLEKEKKIVYKISETSKEINLEGNRYIITDKDLNYTIIEILEEDNINNYLEVNNEIYNKNEKIYSFQYQNDGELIYSHGKILEIKNDYIMHDIGTLNESSGCPIILMKNLKLIGLNKGTFSINENKMKTNIGISMNLIINKITDDYNNVGANLVKEETFKNVGANLVKEETFKNVGANLEKEESFKNVGSNLKKGEYKKSNDCCWIF